MRCRRPRRDFRPTKRAFSPICAAIPIRVVIPGTSASISSVELLSWITEPSIWASLATLTCLEIVLGIDNLVFITIVTGKLPERDQPKARVAGLMLALLTRILLLLCISWLTTLTGLGSTFLEEPGPPRILCY